MQIAWSSAGTDYITALVAKNSGVDATTQGAVSGTVPGGGQAGGGGSQGKPSTGQPVVTPPTGNNDTAGNGGSQPAQTDAPAKPYADPSHPPNNDPNAGWFWSNTAHQWVSNQRAYDANGKALTPEQQKYWNDQDKLRAQRTLANWRPGMAKPAEDGIASDAPVYDASTQTYSYHDGSGKWYHGLSKNDVYSKLSPELQEEYPEWYFGQYADSQDTAKRSQMDASAFDNQSFATRGSQTTRYSATNF